MRNFRFFTNYSRMVKIGTHSGSFHADEALAVYMLRQLKRFGGAEVVRSREMQVLEGCDIVVDVGGKYDGEKYFDHHQRGFSTTFGGRFTTKLSSAGLVYKHFGREVVSEIVGGDGEVVEGIYERVYEKFIEAVDGYDNGIEPFGEKGKFETHGNTLRAVVSNLVPLWGEGASDGRFDEQFEKASELMGMAFKAEVRSQGLGWYPARSVVVEAFKKAKEYDSEGRILVFDCYVPWSGHIYDVEGEYGEVLYVVYPSGDSVRVQAVAVSAGSFESRRGLPSEWRGLRDEELSEVSGVSGCVFVHAGGFIGGNRSVEGAIAMAKSAIADTRAQA